MRLIVSALCQLAVAAHTLPSRCDRRGALAAAAATAALPLHAAHASLRAELLGGQGQGCTYGEGDKCAELAEGNELILKLQKRSRDNKEKNELDLYEMNVAKLGYDDYLMSSDKVMVRTDASGKYKALTLEQYYAAKKAGRLSPGVNGIENLDATPEMTANGNVDLAAAAPVVPSVTTVKQMILDNKVEGVIFKAPLGMTALAVSGDKVFPVSFDKMWKREEFYNLCEKRGLPNNLQDVLAGKDALAGK